MLRWLRSLTVFLNRRFSEIKMVTVEGKDLSPAAQAFFDYALSADAASIISAAGAVAAN